MTSPTLRVLLVDDETLARMRLRSLIAEIDDPKVVVVAESPTAMAARVWMTEHQCDVVLLDIAMPGLNGMQFAAELRQQQRLQTSAQGHHADSNDSKPVVIFITAHPEHALHAFEVEAVDYLTKPVRRDRLQAALRRAAQRLSVTVTQNESTLLASSSATDGVPGANEVEPVIVVSDRGRIVRVPVSEALYFKAELKYVTLRTAQHSHVLDDSLGDLEKRVGPKFIRVHRNALVAKHAVRALERRVIAGETDEDGGETWAVRVAPLDEWLAVSRRQVAAVREALAADGV
ncbi:MAG: LytR/AlgR family response regulator transcription factor [Burkholderiaceae bacterium]